jgi:hypothetical protein
MSAQVRERPLEHVTDLLIECHGKTHPAPLTWCIGWARTGLQALYGQHSSC